MSIKTSIGWRGGWRDGLFLVIAFVVVAFFVWRAESLQDIGFPLDDSWIHQTYARNLAEHGEWAYTPGQLSTASTSPLYTVLLALGHLLNLAPFVWAYGLGVLALALGASMAARLAGRMFPKISGAGWVAGLMTLTAWHVVWAAASGMETMLFMTLSLAVMWRAYQEVPLVTATEGAASTVNTATQPVILRGFGLGVLGGLLTLTRPEGFGLLGLAGLLALVAFGWREPRRYTLWAVAVGVGWLIAIAPYTLWNYDLTGELLPSTASAKVAETAPFREQSIPTRYGDMLLPLVAGAQILALPGMVVGGWLLAKQTRKHPQQLLYFLPLVWAFAHLTLFVLRLPAPFQHGRYVMPILPPLLLYAAGGLLYILAVGRRTPVQRIATRALVLSALAAFPAFLWIGAGAYARDVRIINTEMVATAKWVDDNIDEGDLFAVHDIGALGYYAPRTIVDLAGLVSPEIVPIINDYPAQMDYICRQGASWLMVLPDQRPATRDDPRLDLAYESPFPYANEARDNAPEPWKMRVYRLECP